MYSIGDFARHGLVSVRMLRHYDAIGLLRPAHVDPASGYRFYQAAQFARLHRIIALKGLGFTLGQVQSILDEQVSVEELHGMLRMRRADLAATISADTSRLTGVQARLHAIENEGRMPTDDVLLKRISRVRVAELVATAASYAPEDIGPVLQPLFPELLTRLARAGLTPTGPAIAYYTQPAHTGDAGTGGDDGEDIDGEDIVVVHAALPVAADLDASVDVTIVDLPDIPTAATLVHRGPVEDIVSAGQALSAWIENNNHRAIGYARELYLECPPQAPERWVTELQAPVAPR